MVNISRQIALLHCLLYFLARMMAVCLRSWLTTVVEAKVASNDGIIGTEQIENYEETGWEQWILVVFHF